MRVGVLPQLFFDFALARMADDAVVARQYAFYVAVEDRKTQSIGLRKDRARRGAADAGKGGKGIEVARHFAVVVFHTQICAARCRKRARR